MLRTRKVPRPEGEWDITVGDRGVGRVEVDLPDELDFLPKPSGSVSGVGITAG